MRAFPRGTSLATVAFIMNKTARALVILAVSLVLTSTLFSLATKALYRGTDAVDTIRSSIRAAHTDPPSTLVHA